MGLDLLLHQGGAFGGGALLRFGQLELLGQSLLLGLGQLVALGQLIELPAQGGGEFRLPLGLGLGRRELLL